MNDSLIICRVEDSPFCSEDVVSLIHESFKERLDQGLCFTCSSITVEQFDEKMSDGITLVAYDDDSMTLLGTASTHLYLDSGNKEYGYYEYMAVIPSAKRMGIGSRLLEESIINLKRQGAEYVISDTACGARSSVKWHLKNGFHIIALRSYSSTNYYSYIFRKQLVGKSRWDNCLYRNGRFVISYVKTKLKWSKDGSERFWFRFFHKTN